MSVVRSAAVTTDIYSEGLQILIVKYPRAGIVNQEIHEIIRINVRLPERAMGDCVRRSPPSKRVSGVSLELLDRYVSAGDSWIASMFDGSR